MSEVLKKILNGARAAAFQELCVTVQGGHDAVIENVTNMYECNEIMARMRTSQADVTVWGQELKMSSFKDGVVRISGVISSVELDRREGVK